MTASSRSIVAFVAPASCRAVDVRPDDGRGDLREAAAREIRLNVEVDAPLGVRRGAAPIPLLVLDHVFERVREEGSSDAGRDRNALGDVALLLVQETDGVLEPRAVDALLWLADRSKYRFPCDV